MIFFVSYVDLHLETNWFTYMFYQISDALRTIMREEGLSALYKGIFPGLFLVYCCLLTFAYSFFRLYNSLLISSLCWSRNETRYLNRFKKSTFCVFFLGGWGGGLGTIFLSFCFFVFIFLFFYHLFFLLGFRSSFKLNCQLFDWIRSLLF